jgi:hypothetical protein
MVRHLGARFTYEEEGVAASRPGDAVALTGEALADLPTEWVER